MWRRKGFLLVFELIFDLEAGACKLVGKIHWNVCTFREHTERQPFVPDGVSVKQTHNKGDFIWMVFGCMPIARQDGPAVRFSVNSDYEATLSLFWGVIVISQFSVLSSQFSALSTASSSQDICVWSDAHKNTVKLEWLHLPRFHLALVLHPLVYYTGTSTHTHRHWPLCLCMPYHGGSAQLLCWLIYWPLETWDTLMDLYACRLSLPGERKVFVETAVVFYLWKVKSNKPCRILYYKMIVLASGLIPLFPFNGTDSSNAVNQPFWMAAYSWPLAPSLHHLAQLSEYSLFLLINSSINKTLGHL